MGPGARARNTRMGEAMTTVDFIYGLGSRYSYLAATQLARIARETGATFRWRPLASSRLIGRRADDPFAAKAGGQYDWDYRRRDAEAWAAFYGVPFRDPVGRLTHDPMLPALAALASARQGAVVGMSHRLFRLHFADDLARYGREEVVAEAKVEGLDVARFERDLDGPALREEHDAEVERAVAQGAFGVPTFLLGERLFWGNDRLVLLEAALRGQI